MRLNKEIKLQADNKRQVDNGMAKTQTSGVAQSGVAQVVKH